MSELSPSSVLIFCEDGDDLAMLRAQLDLMGLWGRVVNAETEAAALMLTSTQTPALGVYRRPDQGYDHDYFNHIKAQLGQQLIILGPPETVEAYSDEHFVPLPHTFEALQDKVRTTILTDQVSAALSRGKVLAPGDQERIYRDLFDRGSDANLLLDYDTHVIIDANQRALEMYGVTREEIIGMNMLELVTAPEHLNMWRDTQFLQTSAGEPVFVDRLDKKKDGTLMHVTVSGSLFEYAGRMIFQDIIRDETQRLQAEADLKVAKEAAEAAQNAAEAANRAKSTFLANMSHEIRTPLTAILGFSQLMERDPELSPAQQTRVNTINRAGEHLLALINDVLEMSKIEAGKAELNPVPFDLWALLDDLLVIFEVRTDAKGLGLQMQRSDEVPQTILADQGKLRQVLINLIGNAVKFTHHGDVALRVTALPENLVQFEIEDTGPGIPPEDLDQIFNAFMQATHGDQTQEGTGLGLAISQQFVQLMGGEITVRSRLGWGSTFTFTLPITPVETDQVADAEKSMEVTGVAPDQPTYRLLVVDDQADNRTLLIELLQPLGFELQAAENGQQAVDIFHSWRPDLIWMDMRMPVMDGIAATQAIRASGTAGQQVPIIALTASTLEQDRADLLAIGCNDFIRKPYQPETIFTALNAHLGVAFIYQDVSTLMATPTSINPDELRQLPPEWLAELHQAAVESRLGRINRLVEQIRSDYPEIAAAFSKLVDDFNFEILYPTSRMQMISHGVDSC